VLPASYHNDRIMGALAALDSAIESARTDAVSNGAQMETDTAPLIQQIEQVKLQFQDSGAEVMELVSELEKKLADIEAKAQERDPSKQWQPHTSY